MTASSTILDQMGYGSPGRYQLLAGFLLCCIQLPVTFTDHLLQLYAATPMHRCRVRVPQMNNISLAVIGESEFRPLVEKHGKKLYSSCEMYVEPKDHSLGTQSCLHGWEFLNSEEEWTLVTEWNLVCEREYLIDLLPYVYYTGTMVGSLLFGVLADHFGRKVNLLIALFLHTALGIGLHFLPSFAFFAAGYALQGIFVTGIQCLSFILLLETVAYPYHLKATILLATFWPLGILVLAVLSWLIRNWRYIQVAVTSPGIVCIGYFWLLPRSLPWLLTESKLNEAEDQLLRFARFNKTLLPQNFRMQLQNYSKAIRSFVTPSGSQHSLETVVCSAKIRRFTFILYYLWFVVSFASNASNADVPALDENKYAFLFVKGLMDLGMIILLYFLAHRLGPRFMQAILLTVGGILCIGSAFVDYYMPFQFVSETNAATLMLMSPVFAVVGKAAIRAVLATNLFFSLKVFPTGVRAIGVGSCLFWTRSALLLGHHVSSVGTEESNFLLLAVCGVLSLIGGGLTFLLPSATRRPLPNVAHEVEKNIVIDGSCRKGRVHFGKPSPMAMSSMCDSPNQHVITDMPKRRTEHFQEVKNHDENSAVLELNVQEVPTLRLKDDFRNYHRSKLGISFEGIPGPSREFSQFPEGQDKEDVESRLTDLEEELTKIWDLNTNEQENDFSAASSLREFHRGDLREHFHRMNETSF